MVRFFKGLSSPISSPKVINNYIVDFYCHKSRLIIALDGSQHYEEDEAKKDQIRTEKLEDRGLIVIRIPNNEVMRNFTGVCEYIHIVVTKRIS